MVRKYFTLFLFAILMSYAVACTKSNPYTGGNGNEPEQPSEDDSEYVVILSMDAFRWDLADMASTPTLDSVKSVGVYSEVYPCFPSVTFPNHYSMATGLHPDHHGIVNNTFYDKTMGKQYTISNRTMVQNPDFYYGEPIWNTAERQGKTANVFMWVGSEAPVNGRYATVWTEYTSDFSFETRADWVVSALNQPKEKIPHLIMWYFEEPDAVSHSYSSTSRQTRDMVERIDSVIARMLRGARTSPVYDKINFIFTADHGMTTLAKERYLNVYSLLDNSKIDYYDNSTPLFLEPKADYIDEAYRILSAQEHIKVYKRDQMPERFHYGSDKNRIKPLIVVPESGWKVTYTPEDFAPIDNSGAHGYDPADRDMHMVFYGFGPSFKRGYIKPESFQNLNDYIIMCHLLGIEPAQNDCSWDDVKDLFTK